MKDNIKLLVGFISMIMLIDMIAFMAWSFSSCQPQDGFFLGSITNYLINLF